jgi:hypothetical protein
MFSIFASIKVPWNENDLSFLIKLQGKSGVRTGLCLEDMRDAWLHACMPHILAPTVSAVLPVKYQLTL